MFTKRIVTPLDSAPLAETIPPAELQKLDRLGTMVDLKAGRRVIDSNTIGRQFLVVIDGECEVQRSNATIARLGAGEFAGELALLTGKPCNADVLTAGGSVVYALSRREFSSLMHSCPGINRHVRAVAADRLAVPDGGPG